jgi:hypothetical protein
LRGSNARQTDGQAGACNEKYRAFHRLEDTLLARRRSQASPQALPSP